MPVFSRHLVPGPICVGSSFLTGIGDGLFQPLFGLLGRRFHTSPFRGLLKAFHGIYFNFGGQSCSFVSLRIMRYSCFRGACSCTTGLESLLIGVFLFSILATKNGVTSRVSPELSHYFMVRRELIKTVLEKLDVFLVSRDAFTLHAVVLNLRLNQAHCHLIIF